LHRLRALLIVVLLVAVFFLSTSGGFLIVNDLQRADVIVVLAGETNHRPGRALQLLAQKYAPKVLLDVPLGDVEYDRSLLDIAKEYIQHAPQSQPITICPIVGLSTKTEAQDVVHCLGSGTHRVLVVTSDFHTRRARSVFEHELPRYQIFVTPAYDPTQFGTRWWQHRQWAKNNFEEWLRLVWWKLVDRWR
jgi:DUF218 domain-containing protein